MVKYYKQVGSVKREMTAEEVSELEANQAAIKISEDAIDAAEAQKATLKASAKAKLIAGEALTQAEADTIVI